MRQVVDRDGREIKEGGDEKIIRFTIYGCKTVKEQNQQNRTGKRDF